MTRAVINLLLSLSVTLAVVSRAPRVAAQPSSLAVPQLEATIPLGDVLGRIDHMALDPDRHRLFVAETWR